MKRRILVIDDDPSICELLKLELEERDFEVVTENTAEAALRTLGAEDFGVVISDINMRGMTGVELCERAVALRADTPVVVMTVEG